GLQVSRAEFDVEALVARGFYGASLHTSTHEIEKFQAGRLHACEGPMKCKRTRMRRARTNHHRQDAARCVDTDLSEVTLVNSVVHTESVVIVVPRLHPTVFECDHASPVTCYAGDGLPRLIRL